jgi:hypothetical protein
MMQNVAFVVVAFIGGFIFQAIWWRVSRPSLSSILLIFALVYAALSVTAWHWNILQVGAAEYSELTLLYLTVLLSHTILCSAVQARSPTLSIVTCIADHGEYGCPDDELKRRFLAQDAIMDRLKLMERSGLIAIAGGRCAVTGKGLLFARLFEFGARFFGLAKGG